MEYPNKAGSKTPPPAYTPSSTSASFGRNAGSSSPSASPAPSAVYQNQGYPGAVLDPYNQSTLNYNPWADSRPDPALAAQGSGFGPTPASALHIPYAYYDPQSEHSLAEADARASRRFWEALIWVVMLWIVFGFLVGGMDHSAWREGWGDVWSHVSL